MVLVVISAALVLVAFAIPYHAPRLGMVVGAAGLALSIAMMLHAPTPPDQLPRSAHLFVHLDFDLDRPIGVALGLFAMLWLMIATVQLTRRATTR